MDSVFQKLEDIEMTAEAIVEHAEEEKAAIEKRLQEERDQFDAKLAEEKERHHSVIDNLENDYNQNRKAYVKEILERIIEV